MRFGSSTLVDALTGSFNWRFVADVISNGERILQDVPLIDPSFTDDGTSLVQGTGSCTIVYQGDFGESIAPSEIGDLLSPFGTQLSVSVLVTVGDGFQERVPFGQYLIAETPSILTQWYLFNTAVISKGDQIQLNLKDRFYGVQRDEFDVPSVAPEGNSVWSEYQRLTELPVTRTVTDGVISSSVAYQQDKLQACYDLANLLDATACMTPDGTASMRPNEWPTAVATMRSADPSKPNQPAEIVSLGKAMSNDSVYNSVIVRTNASDGTAVLARSEITTGPLRTKNSDGSLSPYRRVPYFYSSDYVTTQDQGQAVADLLLPRVSTLRAVKVPIVEKFNPLRDVGDVINVKRLGDAFAGRVTNIARTNGATQTTTVVVNP